MPVLDKKIEDEAVRTISLPSEAPADPTQRRIKPTPEAKPPKDRVGPVWGPNPADKTEPAWVRTPSEEGEKDLEKVRKIRWRPLPGKPEELRLGAMRGQPYPSGPDRQRIEQGEARKHDKLLYRKNRHKNKQRSKLWYQKNKRNPAFKRDKKRRQEHPDRFKRLPGGWSSHSEKDRDRRKQERIANQLVGMRQAEQDLIRILDRWRQAQDYMVTPLVKKMDRPEDLETRSWRVYPEHILRPPWTDPGFGDLPDLEGPHRGRNPVSPELPHKNPRKARVSGLIEAERKVNPEVKRRTRQVQVRRVGKDSRGIWTFRATSSEGDPHRVEVQQVGGESTRARCSCPAWVYQGCEYHARQGDYLLGAPRGPATKPKQRDPQGKNLLCKHVLAVLAWLGRH